MKNLIAESYFAFSLILLTGMNFEHPLTFLALANFLVSAIVLKRVTRRAR